MYKKMGNTNLKHIGWSEMEVIAEAAHCTPEYVNLILKGDRKKKSVMARKISKAAEQMNNGIEKALNKSVNGLENIDDNN